MPGDQLWSLADRFPSAAKVPVVNGQVSLVVLLVPQVPPASECTVVQVMLLMCLCELTSACVN